MSSLPCTPPTHPPHPTCSCSPHQPVTPTNAQRAQRATGHGRHREACHGATVCNLQCGECRESENISQCIFVEEAVVDGDLGDLRVGVWEGVEHG